MPYPQAAIGVVRAELAPRGRTRSWRLATAWSTPTSACALGAFDEALAPGAVLDRALAVARELAAMPPKVYARTKGELRGATLEALRINAERDPLLDAWVGAP